MRRWIEHKIECAMLDYAEKFSSDQPDHSCDEQIYRQVKALEGDSHALSKLGAILKPSPYSAEELLDEYVSEKYGV